MTIGLLHKYTLIVGMALFLGGCLPGAEVIELNTLTHLQITEVEDGSNHILTVQGLLFASSLGIDKVQVNKIDNELNMLVHAGPAGKTRSGNLAYQLTVPADVTSVTFGKTREIIWSRK